MSISISSLFYYHRFYCCWLCYMIRKREFGRYVTYVSVCIHNYSTNDTVSNSSNSKKSCYMLRIDDNDMGYYDYLHK